MLCLLRSVNEKGKEINGKEISLKKRKRKEERREKIKRERKGRIGILWWLGLTRAWVCDCVLAVKRPVAASARVRDLSVVGRIRNMFIYYVFERLNRVKCLDFRPIHPFSNLYFGVNNALASHKLTHAPRSDGLQLSCDWLMTLFC